MSEEFMVVYTGKHHCVGQMVNPSGEIVERGEPVGETPSKVDPKGYIPLSEQVARTLAAGERLVAFRKGMYDSDDPNYDGEPNPLSDPSLYGSDVPGILADHQMKMQQKIAAVNTPISEEKHDDVNDVKNDEIKSVENSDLN